MEDGHGTLHPFGHGDGVRLAKPPNPTAQSHPQLPPGDTPKLNLWGAQTKAAQAWAAALLVGTEARARSWLPADAATAQGWIRP